MKKTKIIAVANQKGGVGKTSTTLNLGYTLSKQGYKILLVDLDPQHNLSNYLNFKDNGNTLAEVIAEELKGNIVNTPLIQSYSDNLDYIPTNLNLSAIDMLLVQANAREYVLLDVFERYGVFDKYDYIIIDCMPALNILLVNALTASHDVIIPVEASYGAFEGLEQLFGHIEMIKKRLNRTLNIAGIVFTKTNNTNITKEVRNKLTEKYPNLLFENEIKELTEARKSYAERIPLSDMKNSRLASDYENLAIELIERGE